MFWRRYRIESRRPIRPSAPPFSRSASMCRTKREKVRTRLPCSSGTRPARSASAAWRPCTTAAPPSQERAASRHSSRRGVCVWHKSRPLASTRDEALVFEIVGLLLLLHACASVDAGVRSSRETVLSPEARVLRSCRRLGARRGTSALEEEYTPCFSARDPHSRWRRSKQHTPCLSARELTLHHHRTTRCSRGSLSLSLFLSLSFSLELAGFCVVLATPPLSPDDENARLMHTPAKKYACRECRRPSLFSTPQRSPLGTTSRRGARAAF